MPGYEIFVAFINMDQLPQLLIILAVAGYVIYTEMKKRRDSGDKQ